MSQILEIINESNEARENFHETLVTNNITNTEVSRNKIMINHCDTKTYQFGEKLSTSDITSVNNVIIPQCPLECTVPYNGEYIIFNPTSVAQAIIEQNNSMNHEKCINSEENKCDNSKRDAVNEKTIIQENDIAFLPYVPIFEPFKQCVDDISNIPKSLFKIKKSKTLTMTKFMERTEKHAKRVKRHKYKNCAQNLQYGAPLAMQIFDKKAISKKKNFTNNLINTKVKTSTPTINK